MDHSYYNDTSLILHHYTPHHGHVSTLTPSVLYSLFDEKFENMVKLDWPNPLEYIDFRPCGSGSVNGILCMEGMRRECTRENHYLDKGTVVFWNPATHEYKVSPLSPFAFVSPCWDPLIDFHGFGYDQVSDDYK
ncbi:F-box protein, partial [Trifolium medium]|nr:F-box protein [Trifolium medium]